MIILSNKLTTEQITLILRVIIQILSYGGIFLLGLLVLGNATRTAPLETHDLLNRVVGKSTSTMASFRWICSRLFHRNRDPVSSTSLLLVLALSLCYGIFVSVSDIGLLGVYSCTVPGPSFQDFPASIKSDYDALAIVSANLINGTDPNTIKSCRCEAADDIVFGPQLKLRVCSEWNNSTYGNSSHFSILNSTDSDTLMPKGFAHDDLALNGTSQLNMYLLGALGDTVTKPTLQGGLAVLPYDTGVRMFAGVPQLSQNQKVYIPKTLALEVEIGCIPLGVIGVQGPDPGFGSSQEYIIPDAIYLPERMNNYTGPEYLRAPLAKAADGIRVLLLPYFNSSATSSNGFYPGYNKSSGQFSPPTEVMLWFPPGTSDINVQNKNDLLQNNTFDIMQNCTKDIHEMLNVTFPSLFLEMIPLACSAYQIYGSSLQNKVPSLRHAAMVCATTTQVNMISATLEMDGGGALAYDFTRLPSNLNIVQANYFEVVHDYPEPGETTYNLYDTMGRFTLSDNPAGPSQHYIFQADALTATASVSFNRGSGSIGPAFSQVGSAMISFSLLDIGSLGIVNPNPFSTNFSTQEVTKWASSLGASYLLSSIGYNGWAARASQAFTVVSTGGEEATCYNLRYGAAFLPLFLAAFIVIIWALAMLFTSKIHKAKRFEEIYGGLSPIIEFPYPGRLPAYTHLVWEDDPEPHLKPSVEKMFLESLESQVLVLNTKDNEIEDALLPGMAE